LANEAVLARVHRWPDRLVRPVLVLGMEGWIDAGLGAGTAASALAGSMSTETLATFDSDLLIDQRARRPVMRVVNGVNTGLTWPEIELQIGTNASGRTMLILTGPEPDLRWRQFTVEVVALGRQLGIELVVGLGAFPAPVPHTRPIRLAATASTPELAAKVGFLPAAIEVPAGIHASLEQSFATAGIPAVGVWARVPHYAAAMPYPAASAALLDKVAELAELQIDTSALHTAANMTFNQIEQLIANSEEHTAMVRQLERQHDEETGGGAFDLGRLPSGDEIADELERFLRGDPQ
jgi:predicted ATP-grasp superfamily ATP-dependent carboligase